MRHAGRGGGAGDAGPAVVSAGGSPGVIYFFSACSSGPPSLLESLEPPTSERARSLCQRSVPPTHERNVPTTPPHSSNTVSPQYLYYVVRTHPSAMVYLGTWGLSPTDGLGRACQTTDFGLC